jgi:ABC-type branched-subunit amino acid transport system substrate-binding protein
MQAARGGIDARLGIANAAGGVNGRTIRYTWRDDASDLGVNARAARELVEGDGVFGLIEMSTTASGSADYLRDLGVPAAGLATERVWADHENMFSAQTLVSGKGPGIDTWGRYVSNQHGTKALVVSMEFAPTSRDVADALRASLTATGVEIVSNFPYTPGYTTPQQVAAEYLASGADTLVGTLTARDYAEILSEVRAEGAPVKVALSATGYDQSVLDEFGSRIAGQTMFVSHQPFEYNLPAHRTFLDAMVRYAPSVQPAKDQMAIRAYIAADLVLRGLEEAGPCPTREAFIEKLRQVKDFTGAGLLPHKLDMKETFGVPSTCYFFVRVDDSGTRFEAVEPAPLCGSLT